MHLFPTSSLFIWCRQYSYEIFFWVSCTLGVSNCQLKCLRCSLWHVFCSNHNIRTGSYHTCKTIVTNMDFIPSHKWYTVGQLSNTHVYIISLLLMNLRLLAEGFVDSSCCVASWVPLHIQDCLGTMIPKWAISPLFRLLKWSLTAVLESAHAAAMTYIESRLNHSIIEFLNYCLCIIEVIILNCVNSLSSFHDKCMTQVANWLNVLLANYLPQLWTIVAWHIMVWPWEVHHLAEPIWQSE